MSRHPIKSLATLFAAWASPDMERPVWWRTLISRDRWALLLITQGKPGDLPPRPPAPAPRLTEEWARKAGADLPFEQQLYARIRQRLRAQAQDQGVPVETAASIATGTAMDVLAEIRIALPEER